MMTEPLGGLAAETAVARPPVSHSSKSFSRYEPSTPQSPRNDSPQPPLPEQSQLDAGTIESLLGGMTRAGYDNDIFEAQDSDSERPNGDDDDGHINPLPVSFDQLPIEIVSLMDRFIESLTARVHPAPLSVTQLSQLFQDFYITVEPHIATHVAALATKYGRERSSNASTPSVSSASKTSILSRAKSSDGNTAEHQMLTTSEITDKRKLRRQLELKRAALEEAVEKGVCEKVYPRLWRHKSADDGELDEKLRSRAAALGLVGVGLLELLSTAKGSGSSGPEPKLPPGIEDSSEYIKSQLENTRTSLAKMDEERYPVGKLKQLTIVHKEIVDFLSQTFPSSSSADEVLPTFIYTIITSHPDSLNLISNLNFIQRFRAAGKVSGEEAYCLTNLEAAITFLDTVDLSALRPDTKPSGESSTPRSEISNPLYRGLAGGTPEMATNEFAPADPPASPSRSGRFSQLLPGAKSMPLEAADSAIDAVHSALDSSFKYFFGRIKEKQASASPYGSPDLAAPKTLEDARKLVNSAPAEEDSASLSERSLTDGNNDLNSIPETQKHTDRRLLDVVGGRPRRTSVDSTKSAGSNKKLTFVAPTPVEEPKPSEPSKDIPSVPSGPGHSRQGSMGSAAVESVKNFGSTFNPLRASWGLRPFGRPSPVPTPSIEASSPAPEIAVAEPSKNTTDDLSPEKLSFDFSGISPPIKRFVDLKEPKELNGYDVEMLLRDYQRLAGALAAAGAPPPS